VLAHLFLDHMLDLETAFVNFEFNFYQQPLNGMTPQKVIETGLVPPNLRTTILLEEQFRRGYVQGPLSAEALGLWETAWSEVKST
jgi:hypothetical protein